MRTTTAMSTLLKLRKRTASSHHGNMRGPPRDPPSKTRLRRARRECDPDMPRADNATRTPIQVSTSFHHREATLHEISYHVCKEYLEIDHDSDVWIDWDERCHGRMDTREHEREFPDGFK